MATGWFGTLAYREVEKERHLGAGSLVTTGEVVEVHHRVSRFETSSVVVEFRTADGRDVRAEVKDYYWRPEPQIGDRPRLRYDPDHPVRFVRDERIRPDRVDEMLLAAMTFGFLAWAAVLTVRSRSPR